MTVLKVRLQRLVLTILVFFLALSAHAQCDPGQLYDKIVSAYHMSIAVKKDGGYLTWGQNSANSGAANNLAPVEINSTNYPNLTGSILKVAAGGTGAGTGEQGIVLTTTGLFAWGPESKVIHTNITPGTTFAVWTNTVVGSDASTRLPTGVAPTDVANIVASNGVLALLTNGGDVYMLSMLSPRVLGNGVTSMTTTVARTWNRVKTNSTTPLTNVVQIRGQVSSASLGAFMALTSNGQCYTWGETIYAGGGASRTSASYATLMTIPSEFSSSNLPVMIGVTGGIKNVATTRNTFYLLSYTGTLYALGDNASRQCGDFTTTERKDWVKVMRTSTDTFTNVKFISCQEHDASMPGVAVITDTGDIYTWGENDGLFLGRSVDGTIYDPGVPEGFTPGTDKAISLELGGHTLVYIKMGSSQFCYVGHKVSGSMGDGTSTNTNETTFNCTGTPSLELCGMVPDIASKSTSLIAVSPAAIVADHVSTATVTVSLKTAGGVDLTSSGGRVELFTTNGTIGYVLDNSDGTYTATLLSSDTINMATISFKVNGFLATNTATINFTPALIVGSHSVTAGSTISLTDATVGGTWSSSNTSIATIGTSGVVTGLLPGTTTISYTFNGVPVTHIVTVNPNVSNFTSPSATLACLGSSSTVTVNSTTIGTGTFTATYNLTGANTSSGNNATLTMGATTGTFVIPSGVLGSAGTTTVTITAISATGGSTSAVSTNNTASFNIVASVPTAVSASATPNPVDEATNLTLTSSATGAVSFSWAGPNSYTAAVQNPAAFAVVAAGAGIYTVTATNVCGSATGVTSAVSVNVLPTAVSANATPNPVDDGNNLTLTGAATGATSYSWAGPNGFTSTDQNPAAFTASGASAGVYTFIATNSVGSTSATVTVSVNTAPTAVSANATPNPVDDGNNLTLTGTATGATSYAWAGPNGFTSTDQNPATFAASGASAGVYTFIATNSVGSTSATVTVSVNTAPTAVSANATPNPVDDGNNLTLTGTATGATSYAWAGPNGFTSTDQNPATFTASGASAGVYTFIATNSIGSTSATVTVSVNTAPTAVSANATPNPVDDGNNLTLTGTATGATSYAWAGPNGFTSTDQNPATFAASGASAGVYTFVATNSIGSTSATVTVSVNTAPTAVSANATPNPVDDGNNLTLTGTATGATSYAWAGPNGFTSTDQNPATFAASGASAGVYTFIATNSIGSTSATVTVTVNTAPTAVSANATPNPVDDGNNLTLTGAATGATSYAWAGPNGFTSTDQNPATFAASGASAGVYTFIATNSIGSTSATVTVTVNTAPTAVSANATPNPVDDGNNLTLTGAATGATSYAWAGPNGFTSTDQNPTTFAASIASAGVYTFIATNSIGSTSATVTVTVNTAPTAVSANATPNPVNEESNLTLTGTATGATSYAWAGPNGFTSTDQNPAPFAAAPASAGVYTFIATNSVGSTSATVTVSVNLLPSAVSASATPNSVCVGVSVALTASATGATSYSWAGPNGFTSTDQNPASFTAATASAGDYTFTATNSTGSRTVSMTLTVNPLADPGTISGTATVCEESITALTDGAVGGVWSSSNTAIATVSPTGDVTGLSAGTSLIDYAVTNVCGTMYATLEVTVEPLPTVVNPLICAGSDFTFSASIPGGTWTTSNAGVLNVVLATGGITNPSLGNATIGYTSPAGCVTSIAATVAPAVTPNVGDNWMCLNQGVAGFILSNPTPGGTWLSSNMADVLVSPTTGSLRGLTLGTGVITYMFSGSCYTTTVVSVLPAVASITGTTNLCPGTTAALMNTTGVGTWSSTNTAKATIDAVTGVVTGIAPGTSIISYTVNPCCISYFTQYVGALPGNVSGTASTCEGTDRQLTNSTSGGTWSSGLAGIATVSATGLVTPVSPGITPITYTGPTGCIRSRDFTVNALPTAITGTASMCRGSTTTLNTTPAGGAWISANPGRASVNSGTGEVTGVTIGTANLTYNLAGCTAVKQVTVNTAPSAISGPSLLCMGTTGTLTATPTGGTWSSSNTTNVSINAASGLMTGGLSVGTSTIQYILSNGCAQTSEVSVNAAPADITGTLSVCIGSSTTLASSGGGTWSSSAPVKASVNSGTGVVIGVSSGTATISFIVGAGCYKTAVVTVNTLPGAISGANSLCQGAVAGLSVSPAGGVWSSDNTAVASVNATGVLTGVAGGTASIAYQLGTGCSVSYPVTVNALPGTISGTLALCPGGTSTLTATGGGTWSSGNTAVASINATSGAMDALVTGNSTITYTNASGCISTTIATVYAVPSAISGGTSVCQGGTISLSSTPGGGTWTSSVPAVATIDAVSGIVNGISASAGSGTTTISYQSPVGCYTSAGFTVNALPGAIGGVKTVCVSGVTTLNAAPTGGVWSVSNTALATVDAATGVVSGLLAGVVDVNYLAGGCSSNTQVTVIAQPAAITGALEVCAGNDVTLSSASPSGTWSSTNTTAATVDAVTGVVSGLASGNTTISYVTGTGCATSATVTVDPAMATCTGSGLFCIGQALSVVGLYNVNTGGTWASSDLSKVLISPASGVMKGVGVGTATITYTISTGCHTTSVVTVSAPVSPITNMANICIGGNVTLNDITSDGTWSSNNTAVATVDPVSGTVTGIASGSATITYQSGAGCFETATQVVYPQPVLTSASTGICQGASTTFTASPSGGTWSSSNTAAASVNATSGVVTTGSGSGVTTINYLATTGCTNSATLSVNALPGVITGTVTMCAGATTSLSATPAAGVWSSSNATKASVDPVSGVVSGLVAGTATISYNVGGCYRTTTVTVNALPASISGIASVCAGSSATLGSTSTGGTWTSSNTSVATIDPSTGEITTGATSGSTTIQYVLGSGCLVTTGFSVNPTPADISGTGAICIGDNLTLTSSGGGTWSSTNLVKATIDVNTGALSGLSAGTTTVSYIISAGCYKTAIVSVNSLPAAIGGGSEICEGGIMAQSNTYSGGTWSSSNTANATIGLTNGLVTGLHSGTANIVYTLGSGCSVSREITVNSAPADITGTAIVCIGTATTLNATPSGGVWSSSLPTRASINSGTGVVTGLSAGNAVITYSIGSCFETTIVTVNPVPTAITGTATLCDGLTTTLACATGGGSWTTGNIAIANINPTTRVVTGMSPGTADISYTLGSGCYTIRVVTVSTSPAPIIGASTVCIGSTVTLTATPASGTWSSNFPTKAFINSAGVVSGIAAGTANITYSFAGCGTVKQISVLSLPSAITGIIPVCVGSNITVNASPTGGVWSSDDGGVATCTGPVVTGMGAGSTFISYTGTNGCTRIGLVSVNAAVTANEGLPLLCISQPKSVTVLTNPTSGGTWSISNASRIAVSPSSGIMKGMSLGTAIITYKVSAGCYATTEATVNSPVTAIGTLSSLCVDAGAALTNTTDGGTWSSSNTSVATINATTGYLSGIAAGTSYITYAVSPACISTALQSVRTSPGTIYGLSSFVAGIPTVFTCSPGGGSWSVGGTSIASVISSLGLVTGLGAGTTTITYSLSNGCTSSQVITVLASRPDAIVDGTVANNSAQPVSVSIFPNPTSGFITVEASKAGDFVIYSLDGKLVGQYRLNELSTGIQLPYDLKAGIYLCRYVGDNGSVANIRITYQP